jgi:hypothetical protein
VWRLQGRYEEPGQALFRIFVFDRWLELFRVQRRVDDGVSQDFKEVCEHSVSPSL